MDPLAVLCFAAFLLAIVTVVGHGIWVAIAWMISAVSSEGESTTAAQGKPCAACGARFGVQRGVCVMCGAVPSVGTGQTLRSELTVTARQLRRLVDRNLISQDQYNQLAAIISADLARIGVAEVDRPFGVPLPPPLAGTKPGPGVSPASSTEIVDAIVVEEPGAPLFIGEAIRKPAGETPAPPPVVAAPGPALVPAKERFVHPLDRPVVPSPPPQPSLPSRGLAEVLQGFMEESNVRWMEILAGLAIVISSVGLVVSLRSELSRIPYAPACLFALFTLAFHGAGLYTLRRWNLQAVSRVVLIISLLLVPLALSGAVVMSGSAQTLRPVTDPLFLVAVVLGTAAFGWVTYSASNELVGDARWRLTAGILACSLSQIAIQRVPLTGLDFWRLNAVLALPLAGFLIATIGQLVRTGRKQRLGRQRVLQTLIVLGTATFAFLAPLILILVRSEPRWPSIARLSPGLSLAAAAVLALGLLIHRRTLAKNLAAYQTAGTAILIFAGALLLIFVGFTWPDPELLVTVGVINCLVLALLGFIAELPLLYAPAVACAALASVIGLHLAQGRFPEKGPTSLDLVQAFLMGRSGLALTGLAAIVAGIGGWAWSRSRRDDGLLLLFSTTGLAAIALAIVFFSGFVLIPDWPQDRDFAAALLLLYSLALIAAGSRLPWPAVAGVGSFLLWTALVQALWLNETCRGSLLSLGWLPDRPIFVATLAHGMITASAALGWLWFSATKPQFRAASPAARLDHTLAIGAAASLVLVLPAILWVWNDRFGWHAIFALWAAAGWAALAASQRWKWAVSGLQVMLALAAAIFVAGAWHAQRPTDDWIFQEQHLLAQLLLLGLGGIVWSVLRRGTSDREPLRDLLHAPWPAVDQILIAVAAICLPLLAMIVAVPLAGWELGFDGALGDFLTSEARGWVVLAVVLAGLFAALWERVNLLALVGLGIASFAAVWLAAEPFHQYAAAASAVRWAAGIYALVWGAAFIARDQLRRGAKSLPWLRWASFSERHGGRSLQIDVRPQDWFCAQPILFGGLTILIITIVAVAQSTGGVQLRGPLPGTFFGSMGLTACYAGPLLALVAVLLGYAIRERQAAFAFGGSCVFQLAINLAFMLYVSKSPTQPPAVRAIEWLQWNSLAAGAFALVWLGLRRRIAAPGELAPRVMLDLQIATAGATAAALAVWAAWTIFIEPGTLPREIVPLGGLLSYLSLGIFLSALVWLAWTGETTLTLSYVGDLVVAALVGTAALIAASTNQLDSGGQWIAYHILTEGWIIVGVIACGLACWRRMILPSPLVGEGPGVRGSTASQLQSWPALLPHHYSAAAIAALLAILAIRGHYYDPLGPRWPLAAALVSFAIATALGMACRSQFYAYVSTALSGLALFVIWYARTTIPWQAQLFGNMPAAAEAFSLVFTAAAGLWLWREIDAQRRRSQSMDTWFRGPRVHIATIVGILPLYFLLRLTYAILYNQPRLFDNTAGFGAYAVIASCATLGLGALVLALLWDRRARVAIPAAYVWGGIAWLLAIGLASLRLPEFEHRFVAIAAAVALHVALAGQVWSYGANLSAIGARLGISDPIGGLSRTAVWLPVVSVLLAGLVVIADLAFVLTVRVDYLRTAAALGPAICAWGILCLAQERRQSAFQLAALLMAGLSAVYLGWAQIAPDHTAAIWMTRVFRLVMVLAALTFAYGLVLPRWILTSGSWNAATRKAGYITASAAIAAFVATLALEVALFRPGVNTLAVNDVQVIAVAVVLLFLIAGLVSLALLPGRDPLMLSETNRQAYVYAAQVIASLLFAHLYVCRPLWFDGVLRPYWPFVVMGLAFLGVGCGELFHRWKIRVLAEPLERTGALLPILPVIGMWVVGRTDEAQILLVVGLLYLALSFTRKNWMAMVAAAVAGNGALWALLVDFEFNFAGHPQFWLIPPAVSVLLAAQVNRHRLQPEVLTAIRYASTVVIYVSSTSEIFLRGIGDSLWPPMVLLVLAVAGSLAGIALRVRAFLFLGTAFSVLALVAMVAHAARAIEHVWPWWVFGISVGIAILVLFGVFEKKRTEVLLLIGRLKQWEL
jgi:hypothetical protein